jgi:hypothetical protein
MKFIIKETKFNEIIQDYFKENRELFPLKEVAGWHPNTINFHPIESNEDDEDNHLDYSFSYYPTRASYEMDTYDYDDFPLIEMNFYLWEKLESMFGENVVQKNLLDWINSTYKLDAVKLMPG